MRLAASSIARLPRREPVGRGISRAGGFPTGGLRRGLLLLFVASVAPGCQKQPTPSDPSASRRAPFKTRAPPAGWDGTRERSTTDLRIEAARFLDEDFLERLILYQETMLEGAGVVEEVEVGRAGKRPVPPESVRVYEELKARAIGATGLDPVLLSDLKTLADEFVVRRSAANRARRMIEEIEAQPMTPGAAFRLQQQQQVLARAQTWFDGEMARYPPHAVALLEKYEARLVGLAEALLQRAREHRAAKRRALLAEEARRRSAAPNPPERPSVPAAAGSAGGSPTSGASAPAVPAPATP